MRTRTIAARAGTALHAGAALAVLAAALPAPATAQTPDSLARRDSLARASATDTTRRTMVPNAVTPAVDPARGLDAEIRMALFELMHDRDVQALTRLRAVERAGGAGAAGATASTDATGLRGTSDLRFLLAQSYYRLGMDSAFRTAATPLSSGGRYAPVLRGQLMLDAYRRGDFARARQLAQQMDGREGRGLAQLVAGLSDYQSGDHAGARTAFQQAQQAGAPYAGYAQYMEALTLLRADTTQAQAALQMLERTAQSSDAEFADQVRLTAAQLAYESERWPDAIRIAGQVRAQGGLGARR